MDYNFSEASYATVVIVFLLAGCQISDDPNKGGLLGGVKGIATGQYENRVQGREERLKRLQETQGELEAQGTALGIEQQQSQTDFEMEKRRVDKLMQDTRVLEAQLQTLENKQQQSGRSQKELTDRLDNVQSDLERLAKQDESSTDIQALTDERNVLEEEYRLLLEIYSEISQ